MVVFMCAAIGSRPHCMLSNGFLKGCNMDGRVASCTGQEGRFEAERWFTVILGHVDEAEDSVNL